jgi:AbrB family looped-hinge helix DNA binding protein
MEEGRSRFYGAVTVSDRGQIVIPAQARRDLNIEVGEKLLVLGGPAGGLILIRASVVSQVLLQWADVVRRLREEGVGTEARAGAEGQSSVVALREIVEEANEERT